MHEWSIAQSLARMVDERARAADARRVVGVRVRIGDASGVEADLLSTAWRAVREGGLAADVDLDVVRVPVTWACALCRAPVPASGPLHCPACSVPAAIASGDELLLDRIEVETG